MLSALYALPCARMCARIFLKCILCVHAWICVFVFISAVCVCVCVYAHALVHVNEGVR